MEYPKDNSKLPPHLAVLSEKQYLFVMEFVATGNATMSAAAAGYGGPEGKYAGQRGWELQKIAKIKDAILAEQIEHGHSLRTMALKVWQKALEDPDPKIRLAAAKEIADRFGLVKTTQTKVEHKHQFEGMSDDELRAFIQDRAKATKMIDITPPSLVEEAVQAIEIPPMRVKLGLDPPAIVNVPVLDTENDTPEGELARMLGDMPTDDEDG